MYKFTDRSLYGARDADEVGSHSYGLPSFINLINARTSKTLSVTKQFMFNECLGASWIDVRPPSLRPN